MTNQTIVKDKSSISVKTQTIAALIAVVAAVVLPQIFHAVGVLSGSGAAVGAAFLPMYLPILIVGFVAGPMAGMAAGIAAPLISFAVTGMPAAAVLPMIAAEVAACGLFAGLFSRIKMPVVLQLLGALIAAKACRAAATLIMIYAAGSQVALSSVWLSAKQGLPGIILQFVLIPLIVFYVNNKSKNER